MSDTSRPLVIKGLPVACAPIVDGPPSLLPPPTSAPVGTSCTLAVIVAFATASYVSGATTSPVRALIHNASELTEGLWAPGEGTLYGHTNLAAIATAAAAGDARALADAYLPPHRGRSLPSLATFFNVGLLGDGVVVSLDALLLRRYDEKT